MLQELHIESLGVIDRLDLVLGAGLTALTGETGAGKTMLVEAISLLVGGRADASMVRHGAAEARVEGRFVVGDTEHVVARVIPADGRSRAYVDGRLATVATLAEFGERVVDIHGQHAHQSLFTTAAQRSALDRFCRTDLQPLRDARALLTEIDASLAALGGDTRTRARELDLLRFQAAELGGAELRSPDEEADLDVEHQTLAGAVEFREAGAAAAGVLSGDESAVDALGAALRLVQGKVPFAAVEARLRAVLAEVTDLAGDLRHLADSIDDDPARLTEVRERMQALRDLRRKYGETLADVIAFRDEVDQRLAELEGYEGRISALEAQRTLAVDAERRAAAAVAATRRAGAGALADAVAVHIRSLAMPHAEVAVTVGETDPGDEVAILFSANPGAPLLPLSRVASGGELARTMLALRLVLTEAPDTLVFDEVDAGIGGAAALAVGERLAELGERHQVLVVTHLAQVAAMADHHVMVDKRVQDGSTTAVARTVDADERVHEVARMLAGDTSGKAAVEHAAELLQRRVRRSRG